MYNNALELIKWWADRITFTIVVNLVVLGAWFTWHQMQTFLDRDMVALVQGLSTEQQNELAEAFFAHSKGK